MKWLSQIPVTDSWWCVSHLFTWVFADSVIHVTTAMWSDWGYSHLCHVTVSSPLFSVPHSPDLDSPALSNQHAPIPYEQLHHHSQMSPGQQSPMATDGYLSGSEGYSSRSLKLPPRHPLKSFTLPGPPSQMSTPNTSSPKQHIGMLQEHATYTASFCLSSATLCNCV